jgi:hypothetical protein
MISLVEELLTPKTIDEVHIQNFLNMYPSLRNRDPYFYYKKCGIISILFHEFLKSTYNVNSTIIAGKVLNVEYIKKWMYVSIPEVNKNITNGKKFGHAVVLVNNMIYDLSSLQFTKDLYSIYSLNEFKKRWKIIDYTMFNNYDKIDYTAELREII